MSELPWSWTKLPLPWPLITVGIVNKLITEGLFVFSFVFARADVQGGGRKNQRTGEGGRGERGGSPMEGGVRVKGLSSLPGCMLLSLALSSPIKPATPQQYGAINYRHAAINAERRGEERQEHINRTNGHIKDIKPCSLPLSNTHTHSLCTFYLFEMSLCFWMSLGLFQIQMGKKKKLHNACIPDSFMILRQIYEKG